MKLSIDMKYWISVIVLLIMFIGSCIYLHERFAIYLLIGTAISGAFFIYYNNKISDKYEGGR